MNPFLPTSVTTASNPAKFIGLDKLMLSQRDPAHAVAFGIVEPQSKNWEHFYRDVSILAHRLQQQSQKKYSICCLNSYWFAVAFMACAHTNKTLILPANYQLAALSELVHQFDQLIIDEAFQQQYIAPLKTIAPLETISPLETNRDELLQAQYSILSSRISVINQLIEPSDTRPNLFQFQPLDLNTIELILFTSGSTGMAKAISKSLNQLVVEVSLLQQLWGEQLYNERVYSTVSHQHIYGLLFRLLWPLCAGRPFADSNLDYPEQLTHYAAQNAILISSPALLKRLDHQLKIVNSPNHNIQSKAQSAAYQMIFSSGGPLDQVSATQCQSILGTLPIEVYGSTETGGIAYRIQSSDRSLLTSLQASPSITAWQLFPNVEASVDQQQCLRLRSPHIEPPLANNLDRWYQTSDCVEFINPQQFYLKGRTDRVVKIEEKRISLVEVEQRLEQLAWIEEAAVTTIEKNDRLSLAAAICLTPIGKAQLELLGRGQFWVQLRAQLKPWLEPISIPKQYRIVDVIPLNSQGKRLIHSLFNTTFI